MRKWIIPGIAGAMLLFAVYHVVRAQQVPAKGAPPVEPAKSPFTRSLAGSGIVEAETENISVGTPLPGVVAEVAIKVGQRVAAGTVLFRIDDRQLRAEEKLRAANLAAAQSQLAKLVAMPRAEELPPAEARVREARANLDNWTDQYERAQKLYQQRAVGEEEVNKLRQQRQAAQEQWDRAKAELALLRAGAWEPDRMVAQANVTQMEAQLAMTRTELDRLAVRAPVAGEVLQVNVRPGEFVGAPPGQPLVVLGNIDRLHVRVDIDENDIHRFSPETNAQARLRGDPRQKFGLKFIRVEPFVIPKKSLTGANTERVDTRVLQVIYALDVNTRVYVGQQLDVFLEARD
ncbi:MAG: HlyD family efflux transporter periplasmic adaptor subunit [Gemmataceae bacterium]|nr:HlyD family efflux transporter periplasmic adaptor subunit [Gemmataceae bacterium]